MESILSAVNKVGFMIGDRKTGANRGVYMKHLMLGAAASALVATSALAQEVRVYNWSDYIDEDLLTKFEEETGLNLIYDVFDSNEVLETKMLAGSSGYDHDGGYFRTSSAWH